MKIMRPVLLFILLTTAVASTAQTREIAYKSHSGRSENFGIAASNERFDPERSDFGVAPTSSVKTAQLDSLIFISDSAVIMVTSTYCRERAFSRDEPVAEDQRWSAGRKIVYLHPLFSKQHALDSIKQVLRQQYHFRNSIDSTIFVGYDNGIDTCGINGSPIVLRRAVKQSKPVDSEFLLILCCIIGSAGIGGGLGYAIQRKRTAFSRA